MDYRYIHLSIILFKKTPDTIEAGGMATGGGAKGGHRGLENMGQMFFSSGGG